MSTFVVLELAKWLCSTNSVFYRKIWLQTGHFNGNLAVSSIRFWRLSLFCRSRDVLEDMEYAALELDPAELQL